MKELWAYVNNFDDYNVSNTGLIVNVKRDRLLKPFPTDRGYMRVVLRQEGVSAPRYMHQLVAEAFLDGWRPGVRVGHKNEDKTNNKVENLELLGQEGRPPKHYKVLRTHARRVQIVETGEVFRTAYDCAAAIGGHASNVYSQLNGKRRTHCGFTFRYV